MIETNWTREQNAEVSGLTSQEGLSLGEVQPLANAATETVELTSWNVGLVEVSLRRRSYYQQNHYFSYLNDLLGELVETPQTLKWMSVWDLSVIVVLVHQGLDIGGGDAGNQNAWEFHFFFVSRLFMSNYCWADDFQQFCRTFIALAQVPPLIAPLVLRRGLLEELLTMWLFAVTISFWPFFV